MGDAPRPRHVAVVVFDEVEVLDFAGPFEVFGVTGALNDPAPFTVSTVSLHGGAITARNGLRVLPHHTAANCPPVDLLVVPGGFGTRALVHDDDVLDWVRRRDSESELTLSVCTGSLVLAAAGLLRGKQATTHHGAFDELAAIDPSIEVVRDVKMVDDAGTGDGGIVTSGGISAGIDMSLGVVARLLGDDAAERTARYMEYDWSPR